MGVLSFIFSKTFKQLTLVYLGIHIYIYFFFKELVLSHLSAYHWTYTLKHGLGKEKKMTHWHRKDNIGSEYVKYSENVNLGSAFT